MSRLSEEITACMQALESGADGGCSARFVFPECFTGFKGHFPGRPVLPGVCKLQAVLAMYQALTPDSVRLQEVMLAKFLAPVGCDEELTIDCREELDAAGSMRVKASIRRANERIAQIEMRIVKEAGANPS